LKDPSFRTHRRMCLSPVGKPLFTVKSVAEFVTVVCDAMRCHSAILKRCNILHRDISENNILVVRDEDGMARGMLIDFDCAVDSSREKRAVRNEMTGTLPYMSINNLRQSDVKRTSLDDWESMLCLVCWFATLGTISGKRRADKELETLPISKWRTGSIAEIILAKENSFDTAKLFKARIIRHFKADDANSDLLMDLATTLHRCLFVNMRFESRCHGTLIEEDTVGQSMAKLSFAEEIAALGRSNLGDVPKVRPVLYDPFKERADEWEAFSEQLQAYADIYRDKAMTLQREAIEAREAKKSN
ncbi:hypothetical protein GGI20_006290, partial [Coemansia sp. BCRC 34301]